MLKTLHIENFAIVDEAQVSFDGGLNVITGETGVGKSLIVDALGIALGERAYRDLIRDGYPSAVVEAVFELNHQEQQKVTELGYDASNITVKREIRLKGGSRIWINGQNRSVQELKQLGDLLVDLHGQHEHQYLLNEEHHIDFLDQFADTRTLRQTVQQSYQQLRGLLREQQERENSASSRREQYQLYAFQLQELNQINPLPNELETLEKERRLLENAQTISEQATQLRQTVEAGDDATLQSLNHVIDRLEDLSSYTESAAAFLPEALAARVSLQGIADFAREYEQTIQADPQRLSEVENRVKTLNHICQKYTLTYEELLAYWAELKLRIAQRDDPDWSQEKLLKAIHKSQEVYAQACVALSKQRTQEASNLAALVVDKLAHLGIPRGRFQIEVDHELQEQGLVRLSDGRYFGDAKGMDKVTFWMQANPGEPLRPLARIASGGEISRIMLAIKAAMSGKDEIGTVIFDEIDTGISGRIARVVGTELKQLGQHHQLISITHLPQIASLADNHFRVEKHFINQRTVTRVKRLTDEERIAEIATLIGGDNSGAASRQAAQELLNYEG